MNTVTEQQQPVANGAPVEKKSTALAPVEHGSAISAFASGANFEAAQRMAMALSKSTLVPAAYQNNLPNCLIAIELASRVNASVLMVAQNLDIIHGRPSWRATFLIATVNSSGKFTPLRYRWEGKPGTDEWGCRAVAKDKETGEECVGPLITIAMAKAEGWYSKNGSKWRTLPELMICYRSASFWSRLYHPESSLGMQTTEEVIDTYGYTVQEATPAQVRSAGGGATSQDLEAMLRDNPPTPAEPEPAAVVTKPEPQPVNAQAEWVDGDGEVHPVTTKGKK